ncbi:MAG: sorting protein [Chthoniobacteraceae bacterium]|nr:sorting protein [Chthoniobacteraceae bacterium]
MRFPRILSTSISSLLFLGSLGALQNTARAAVNPWDGGGIGGVDLGTATNWTDDVLPDVAVGDTALWNGAVAGPLSLVYSNAAFAGAAGNPGIDLSLTAAQISSLNIDSGANTNTLRLNNITIAAGAGAFSLGNGTGAFNITLGGAPGTHVWTNNSANTAAVASDVAFGTGGGGAHTLMLAGSGNWTFNNVITNSSGTISITKNDAGSLTLAGLNTYTGNTTLNAGTLLINNAAALGNTAGGALVINGGTIDNTSGAPLTTTTAKAQAWNGDFTFAGTNNLSFNAGTVTLGGAGNQRTVSLNGGTLTVGNLIGVGYGLNKTGSGTLAIGSGAVSRITGTLNVAGGTVQIAQGTTTGTANDLFVGGLTGSGTIETGNVVSRWLFVQNTADNLFSGTLQNGALGGALGLNKAGSGTLTLTGTNTYTSQTTIGGGALEFGSATTPGITQTLSTLSGSGLVFNPGDSVIKSSFNGTGTASLTFGARVIRNAGSAGNFVISGGTNGTDNRINLTAAAGFLSQGLYFNGDNYAWMSGANSFVRGISYGVDAGTVTSGAATTLASATHQEFTGPITAQETAAFTTLKANGNNPLVLNTGATLTTNGILKSGNVAGGATISGGNGIQAANGAELVIRTDRSNDTLTIATPILANGVNAITSSGAGTLILGAANTYTGTTTVNSNVVLSGSILAGGVNIAGGGTLTLTGTLNGANANNGQINVGSVSGGNAILNINGGTLNAGKTASPSLVIGNGTNSSGFIKMTSGTFTTSNQLNLGNGAGPAGANAYAAFTMTGGNVTSGNWLVVGGNNDRAILNQSGGTLTVAANRMTIGAGGNGAIGIVNQSGGTLTVAAGANTGIFLGENGAGNYTLSGTGELLLNTNGGATSGTMQFAGNATSLGANFNLNGGALTTFAVTKGASTAAGVYRFNFNGGTLRPNADNAAFFADLANTEAYIYGGGGTIDTNGKSITITEPLRAPTGSGLASIGVAVGGVGYIDQPVVTITGGTGTGATAVANVSGGVVTGFTITSPGTGYTPGDVLNVSLFGGGAPTPATVGAVTLGANVGGGLTKSGAGLLTLTTAHSYSGTTNVTGGDLRLATTSSLAGTSGVTINGAGARLVQNSVTPLTAPLTLTNGTLDGVGQLSSVTVGNGTGGIITHGDGTPVALTIDTLTFNGASTLNLVSLEQTPSLITQTLTTSANGKVTINVTNPTGSWSLGNYNLISYSTLGGQALAGFQKGTVPGLGARQAASIIDAGGFIALAIGGDLPVWTGAQNGEWTTNAIGGASNWRLFLGGTPTDFLTGDTVLFDDSATGTTNVNISTADVSPTSTTFDNSTRNYVVTSTGGFGIVSGSLVKNGSGSVTLATRNTYAGGTTLKAGTLVLNHPSAIGTGTLTINGGTIDNLSAAPLVLSTNNTQVWNGDFSFAGSNDLNLGTGPVSLTGNRIIATDGSAALTVGGVISGIGFGITKAGAGTLVFSGANSYTGATDVSAGTLTVTGAINAANTANVGQVTVGAGFENAVMRIAGGTVNASKTASPSVIVGNSGPGALFMESGTLAAASELWVGAPAGAYGAMTVNGGSVTVGSWAAIGRNGAGILKVNGGTLTVTGQNFTLGSFAGANGNLTLTGGTTATTSTAANQGIVIVGEGGTGVLNISGTAALNVSGALGVQVARNAGGSGFVNLNGGTLTTPAITRGAGATGIFNFNGGTLRPTAANNAFMTGLTAAYVFQGGAKIDTNNQNITIAQPLLAPDGSGVSSIALSDGGSGYINAPIIRLIGGTGTGATAVANVINGVLSDIVITNPGTGYVPGDTLSAVVEGGGATTSATLGNINLAPNNTSGGLNKVGAGTLTLSGASSYAGATTVNAGTLLLDATGSINGSASITINGTGAKLVQANPTTAIVPAVNLTTGTLDGTGTVNSVVVGNSTGGVITNGNGGTGVLSIGSLTFSGAGAVNINTAGSIGLAVTGTLATNGPGTVTVNVPVGLPWATGTTYDLISYGTLNGGINGFVTGNIAGLGARQTPTLVIHNNNNVAIMIAGDTPVWTGAASGVWTTAAVGAPFNWQLQIAGTPTEFLPNDQVIFDDTATGTTAISINDATVKPASVTFNNSGKNYTITGAFGISTGLLVKNGTGSVTISNANSYTGGTTVNSGTLLLSGNNNFGTGAVTAAGGVLTLSGSNSYTGATTVRTGGTLNINNATAIGTSVLTVNGGTLGNTSGAAITLTNANAQNWDGDLTFAGPNNLNFNNGAVTIGGAAGQRTVNVTTGTLSTGIITAGAGVGLTKTGNGILAMTSTANASVIPGLLDVQAGTLQIAGDLTVNGGLSGAGTIENGGAASKWFILNNPNDTTFSGTIRDNPTNAAVRLGLVKRGAGTLNLTGANNITTDRFAVENGAVRITGAYTTGYGAAANQVAEIGNTANQTGALIVDGGTFNATRTAAPSLSLGTVAGSQGVIRMTGGTINSANEFWVGTAANSYGALIMSGGTINTGSWLPVGRTGNGIAEISGGTINVNGANYTMGSFNGSNGVTNLSGGTINTLSTAPNEGGFIVGEAASGTLNVSGTGALNIAGGRGLNLAAGTGTGIVNLNGGTVTTPVVLKGAGTGIVNFDGGTISASAANANFMEGLTAAYVNDGGAIIDDRGFNITVAQPLLAPTGNGVSAVNFIAGSGYAGAPLVQISGDGTGATAIATIDTNGNLTGIKVTNPGNDYTFATATLIGGGGAGSVDALSFAPNSSGGLIKKGSGTLTLTGANSYTGATVVEAGTLAIALTGSISGSTSIQAKAGAALDVRALGADFNLANGQTLEGSGAVFGPVAMNEGSKLAPGDAIGKLTFNGNLSLIQAVTPAASGALAFDLAGPGASDQVAFVTGGLSIGGGLLGFDDFAFLTADGFGNGSYTLFDTSTLINGTLNSANLTGTLAPGYFGTLSLADNGNDIVLTVVPEPGSAALLLASVGSLLGLRRFRRRC